MPRTAVPLKERLMALVSTANDNGNGCWEWLGQTGSGGYGRLNAGPQPDRVNRIILAHRASWEVHVGPIPDGLVIDHLCRNRLCVNPEHLEPVTSAENIRRGEAPSAVATRTGHCVDGHPFDEENTIHRPGGGRSCRACGRRRNREYMQRKKAAANAGA